LPDARKIADAKTELWQEQTRRRHTVDRLELARQLAQAMTHSRIAAIKAYRLATGLGLREAMDAIDEAARLARDGRGEEASNG
jgi:ribosomal protein L7/L12